MKLLLDKNESAYYFTLLLSADDSLIKDGIQRLVSEFNSGRRLLRSDLETYYDIMKNLLTNPRLSSIKKWLYKSVCFYGNDSIKKICISNFFSEKDSETRSWIISAISAQCESEEELNKIIHKLNIYHDPLLSKEKISYSTSLFSRFYNNIVKTPTEIVVTNDREGMLWLAKLGAFKETVGSKKVGLYISPETLAEMTYSQDNMIQVYAYWALMSHRNSGITTKSTLVNTRNLHIDSAKWYFSGSIYGEFHNGNHDFIIQCISVILHDPNVSFRMRDGISIGLLKISYTPLFDKYLVEWYYLEKNMLIRKNLILYFAKNMILNSKAEKNQHGTYYTLLQDELESTDMQNIVKSTLLYTGLYQYFSSPQFSIMEKDKLGRNIYILDVSVNEKIDNLINLLSRFIQICEDQTLQNKASTIKGELETKKSLLNKRSIFEFIGNLNNIVSLATTTPSFVALIKQIIKTICEVIK